MLLIGEKSPLCLLPPPFNLVTSCFYFPHNFLIWLHRERNNNNNNDGYINASNSSSSSNNNKNANNSSPLPPATLLSSSSSSSTSRTRTSGGRGGGCGGQGGAGGGVISLAGAVSEILIGGAYSMFIIPIVASLHVFEVIGSVMHQLFQDPLDLVLIRALILLLVFFPIALIYCFIFFLVAFWTRFFGSLPYLVPKNGSMFLRRRRPGTKSGCGCNFFSSSSSSSMISISAKNPPPLSPSLSSRMFGRFTYREKGGVGGVGGGNNEDGGNNMDLNATIKERVKRGKGEEEEDADDAEEEEEEDDSNNAEEEEEDEEDGGISQAYRHEIKREAKGVASAAKLGGTAVDVFLFAQNDLYRIFSSVLQPAQGLKLNDVSESLVRLKSDVVDMFPKLQALKGEMRGVVERCAEIRQQNDLLAESVADLKKMMIQSKMQ